ncbi:hypothetical protein ES332_D06G046900v1 [Gossypium tomentosum]|uniref:Uncharacterized protein n=1 Tax=Gossypium tomentosum TaxID=34277 RepID=A0A5D2KE15_GOSTO|nr:hypothetical protein ES332_D06G046900v1 [Gossypium tomentosum]
MGHLPPSFIVPLTIVVSSAPTFNCLYPAAGQSHPIPVMSEPDCAIIKQDESVYFQVLKISGKEISSTLLPFKDKEKTLKLYTHLVEHHDHWILSYHHLVRYQDEWLVALEYSKNIITYFKEKMERWESSNRNQREWSKYIIEDFGKILKDVACIWAKNNKSIYTQDPIKSIFITIFGRG